MPSGNFGNICAGMMAQQLGLPVKHFVTGTNINKIVPDYLKNGVYEPKPSVATISNAMDVGNPSNFIRIQEIYGKSFDTLKENLIDSFIRMKRVPLQWGICSRSTITFLNLMVPLDI